MKEESKRQVKKVGEFFRDFLFGSEEPEEFLARKARTEPTSPGLLQDLAEVLTPTEPPAEVVDEAREVETATTNAATPSAKRSEVRRGPPPELESACHACRVARRIHGGKCVEHS